MTVIAWDGKVLAADKCALYGDHRRVGTKIVRADNGCVLAACGGIASGLALFEWYNRGCHQEAWPETQKDKDEWATLIVAYPSGLGWYDRHPYRIQLEQPFMAWGRGGEFAMGALAMGATAVQAVEIASKYCDGCGMGIDWLEVQSGD